MLTHTPQTHIEEKIIRLNNGKLARVCVAYVYIDNEVYGRVLSVKLLDALVGTTCLEHNAVFCLRGSVQSSHAVDAHKNTTSYVSPYFTLAFTTSVQPRAPTRA